MISSSSLKFCRQLCSPLRRQITTARCIHGATRNPLNTVFYESNSYAALQRPPTTQSTFVIPHRGFSSETPTDPSLPGAPVSESMAFVKIDGLSEEDQKKFQVIQFEVEVLRQSGHQLPSKIKEQEWLKALKLGSRLSRIKYYRFLFLNEMTELNNKKKKAERSVVRIAVHDKIREEVQADPTVMRYGLNYNTIFPYIRDTMILKYANLRLAQARMFGQPLVFDLDYDDWMSDREMTNVAKQIQFSHAYNKDSRDPFWFQICNAKMQRETMKSLERQIPNLYDPSGMIEVSEKSYRDLFPRSRLVYLTYNAEATLDVFNHDDIYIIGGLVDKTNPKPLSMAKAKREGLRMAKLPLDIFLRWAVGGKNLTLNQMTSILCDMKLHGDWEKAFATHIPKRKYLQPEDLDPNAEKPYHRQLLRPSYQQRLHSDETRRGRVTQQRSVLETLLSQ